MKKLLLIGNPSVLGKNLENILKQNYDTGLVGQLLDLLHIPDADNQFVIGISTFAHLRASSQTP